MTHAPSTRGRPAGTVLILLFVLLYGFQPSFTESSSGASGAPGAGASVPTTTGSESGQSLHPIDPQALLGLTLPEAFRVYGAPESVFSVRGDEPWQDDVVFFYGSRLYLFWYENRVWQVRLDERYRGELLGCSMGMSEQEVTSALGLPLHREADWAVYSLADRGYPVRARLVFTGGLLSDVYIYRSDF